MAVVGSFEMADEGWGALVAPLSCRTSPHIGDRSFGALHQSATLKMRKPSGFGRSPPSAAARNPAAAGPEAYSRRYFASSALIFSTSSALISPTVVTCAVLDPPQAERAGDVAVLVEADRADDAFILDRLAVLDQAERLGELVLAGVDRLAAGRDDFGDGRLDRRGVALAGLGDGQRDDGAGVVGAVGGRRVRLDAAGERLVGAVEIFGRGGRRGARRGAEGVVRDIARRRRR